MTPEEAYAAGAEDVRRAFTTAQQLFDKGTIIAERRPEAMKLVEIKLRDDRIARGELRK